MVEVEADHELDLLICLLNLITLFFMLARS